MRIDGLMMAKLLVVQLLLLYFLALGASQESFNFQRIEDCDSNQFYSTTTFQCSDCGKFQVHSHDGNFFITVAVG